MADKVALTINIDGAARGNPGPAAFGIYLQQEGQPPLEIREKLGHTTNNVAEYTALVHALRKAVELGANDVDIRSDSELLVKQMNGQYRVKNENILPLYQEATDLRRQIPSVRIKHVYREQNRDADRLCNEALDGSRSIKSKTPRSKLAPSETTQDSWGHITEEIAELVELGIAKLMDSGPHRAQQIAVEITQLLKRKGFQPPA